MGVGDEEEADLFTESKISVVSGDLLLSETREAESRYKLGEWMVHLTPPFVSTFTR